MCTCQNEVLGGEKPLKQISTDSNLAFIITFLADLLPKIIHHRNELQNFRSVVPEFNGLFNGVYLDLDIAENLTIPMKHSPQSMYWAQETVTIHSGISKSKDGKTYHPYVSDSKNMTRYLQTMQ